MYGQVDVSSVFSRVEALPVSKAFSLPVRGAKVDVHTKGFDVETSVTKFDKLGFRKKLTESDSTFLNFIARAKKERNIALHERAQTERNKRTAAIAQFADRLAKKARICGPKVQNNSGRFGALYYIKIDNRKVEGDLRKELKTYFKDMIHDKWVKASGTQSLNWRGAEVRSSKVLKEYNHEVEFFHLLTNTTPCGDHYAGAIEDDRLLRCPMCTFSVIDSHSHFLRCPARVGTGSVLGSEMKPWLGELIESLCNSIPKANKELVTKITLNSLAYVYVNGLRFDHTAVARDHAKLVGEVDRKSDAPERRELYNMIFSGVNGTHVQAGSWNQVSPNAYRWNLNGFSPSKGFGAHRISDFVGKVTVIYKRLRVDQVWDIENFFNFSAEYLPMTRVVLVDGVENSEYEKFDKFKTIFKNDALVIVMLENKMAKEFIPCDTTLLSRQLNDLTYYFKKKNRNLLGLLEFIESISSSNICSNFYPFNVVANLKSKVIVSEDSVNLLKVLIKKDAEVYKWFKNLESVRSRVWSLVLDVYEKDFGKRIH